MGMTRSYAFLPADRPPPEGGEREAAAPGWSRWSWGSIPWETREELAADGPALLANVIMSDYCYVAGYVDGEQRWVWSYGYDSEDDEETLPERSAAVARQIAAWARELDHPEPDPDALLTALQGDHLMSQDTLREMLYALGLDAPDIPRLPSEYGPSPGGPGWVDGHPGEPPPYQPQPPMARPIDAEYPAGRPPCRPSEPMARAIDFESAEWLVLVAAEELWYFGEPGALVRFGRELFLASDPPVHAGHDSDPPTPDWVPVPTEYAGDVEAAAAWARESVATKPGRPALPERAPIYAELEDMDRGNLRRYDMAPPETATFSIVTGRDLATDREAVCDWLDAVRSALLDPVIAGYAELGGVIEYGDDTRRTPYSLGVCALFRTSTGRSMVARADAASWRRLIGWARAGKVAQLALSADIASGTGEEGAIWGGFELEAIIQPDLEFFDFAPFLGVRVPDPMTRLGDRAATLAAFRDLTDRAVRQFDPISGCLDAGRTAWLATPGERWRDKIENAGWILLLGRPHLAQLGGLDALSAAYPFASVEPVGDLWRFQATADPRDFDAARRAALGAVLEPIVAAG